jgi:hypothetical protein
VSEKKLKVGDLVRIGGSVRLWRVAEVDPVHPDKPHPPSTYLVVIAPEDGVGPNLRYGNHPLTRVD